MKHRQMWQQLGMTVGEDPEFQYRDDTSVRPIYPSFTGTDLADGQYVQLQSVLHVHCYYITVMFYVKHTEL